MRRVAMLALEIFAVYVAVKKYTRTVTVRENQRDVIPKREALPMSWTIRRAVELFARLQPHSWKSTRVTPVHALAVLLSSGASVTRYISSPQQQRGGKSPPASPLPTTTTISAPQCGSGQR